jgi:hypothetical protein
LFHFTGLATSQLLHIAYGLDKVKDNRERKVLIFDLGDSEERELEE